MENQTKKLRLEDIKVESFATTLLQKVDDATVIGGSAYCDGTITGQYDKNCTFGNGTCQYTPACNE